ncbi:MAG TPA: hypothetical protein VER03_03190 [Bryobacteraceae bacterium]|nr:hypothetical protein [Bryobacteraceae bacterium]
MQFGGPPPVVGIVYNTTLSRADAALALALLYALENKREARVASVAVTENGLGAAMFADAVSRVYQLGPPPNANRVLPIGLAADKPLPADGPSFKAVLDRVDEKGEPLFRRQIRRIPDTAEVTALMRNSFTYFPDGMVTVLLSAPATYLARVLDYPGALELAKAKVRTLIVSECKQDPAAMKRVIAEWPSPIVFCGRDVGEAVPYPGASIDVDFDWAKSHPVVDYYKAAKSMPYDTPSQDVAAVLYAIRPKSDFFQLSEAGSIDVQDNGQMRFTPDAAGKHKRLTVDPAKKELLLAAVREVLHTKPVAPPQRRRLSPEEIEKLRKEREEEQLKRELEEKKKLAAPPPTSATMP